MQLIVTVLFGLVIPIIAYGLVSPSAVRINSVAQFTIAFSASATIAAVILLTRMIRYPGVSHAGTIFPAFGSAYGIVLAALLLLREPYSNALLILCFSICDCRPVEAVYEPDALCGSRRSSICDFQSTRLQVSCLAQPRHPLAQRRANRR